MKKRFFLLTMLMLSALASFSQVGQQDNPLNAYTQKIIYAQIAKSIGVKFPLVLGFSGFVYAQNVNIANDRIYYSTEIENMSDYSGLNKVGMKEMKEGLKVKFTGDSTSNKGFLLNAYVNDRLSLRLKYLNDGKSQRVKMESPSSKRSKVDLFENNKLVSSVIAKKNKVISFKNISIDAKFTGSSLYSSLVQKGGKEPSSIAVLYKSEDFLPENIIRIQHHFNSTNNMLVKVVTLTKDLKVTDSTTFIYTGNLLVSTNNYNGNNLTITKYEYDSENRTISKSITSDKKSYTLKYAYGPSGHLSNVNITSYVHKDKTLAIDLIYNAGDNLISASVTDRPKLSKVDKLKNQYNFSYDEKNNINKLRQINRRGRVKKEIAFVSELL